MKHHTSVLLNESINALNITKNGKYIDCTLGEAGHSLEILSHLGEEGALLSLDQDGEVIRFVKESYPEESSDPRWHIVKGNFSRVGEHAKKAFNNEEIKFDGILMDLGISSRQLELDNRGFSYQKDDEQLDMRMDQEDLGVTAKDLLRVLNEHELTKLFRLYGEERFASRIARYIKGAKEPVTTVKELNYIVERAVPASSKINHKHPARRIYQALRIAVNDELNSLKRSLEAGFELLAPKGRLVIISFHSLEDRIVKTFFKELVKEKKSLEITKDPILPSDVETELNPRSRSAKLRILEKL